MKIVLENCFHISLISPPLILGLKKTFFGWWNYLMMNPWKNRQSC
ncbi:hypothetical protein SLEP1_g42540 [Rubroshorea leprosula]|uniref:Uncharacterized protein n=1 Tax=Rubroshorea leprosula TaxID=152421 RepID=A0AAV5LAD3_9ROSI|nr:hypothetical protein SLEP1_g42540 [Rubroshorea leprosula]